MFDDPGKKLKALEQELWEADPMENPAADLDDAAFDDEEFNEEDAVLAGDERRPGLRTLVLLGLVALAAVGMRWLGWI